MAEQKTELNIEQARKQFIKMRNKLDSIARETPSRFMETLYGEEFIKIYTEASLGNIVAQDFLGYIFKRGREGLIPENIDLSMKWLLLAGANGNPLSIERLAIFLNFAFDEIVRHPEFDYIQYKNDLTVDNFNNIIGKLICEALVDELKIDALQIIKEIPEDLPFNNVTMGKYDKARNRAIAVVIAYLKGENPTHNN